MEPEKIVYDLKITEWNRYGMILLANFTEPTLVSVGVKLDKCFVNIIDESLFVSEATGIMLDKNYKTLTRDWPKQYAIDYDLERTKRDA